MAKQLIEIPLDDTGAVVIAEVEDNLVGWAPASPARSTEKVADTLGGSVQASLERVIEPTARLIVGRLRQLSPNNGALNPDGVEIEFGLRLVGKAGAVFASSELEGHIKVRLSWAAQRRV